jgi:hypothetical protein
MKTIPRVVAALALIVITSLPAQAGVGSMKTVSCAICAEAGYSPACATCAVMTVFDIRGGWD